MKKLTLTLIITLLLVLQSCSTLVKSEITVFHNIDKYEKEKTFFIFPVQEQVGSLEFQYYSDMIKNGLITKGMIYSNNIDNANIVILFSYGIDDGKQKIGSVPVYGKTGIASSSSTINMNNYGGNIIGNVTTRNTPSYGVVGTSQYSYIEYGRFLWIGMFDKQSVVDNQIVQLYNGTIISTGTSSNIKEVLPAMINAFFNIYPGISGKVERVILPSE